ncbi:MAG TPA: hypothetical protein VGU27_11255 [Candidatus Eisenbacteria bacterium]|nr:hypothetical protein [Candidatus Eisenbacteria bacterium]
MKKRRFSRSRLGGLALRLAKFVLKSQLLTIFLLLCGLGFWAGTRARPGPQELQRELFENLGVLSYRQSPTDSSARFVVQLAADGHVFREYDVDARRFEAPEEGRDYRRAISGTHYPPLRLRGHVDRGFWLELPEASGRSLLPGQFEEVYRTTLAYVKPVSVATSVLGTLSGYAIGYRAAMWSRSLANPAVQERMLATPGLGRALAHEAWRRVLLEPVVMANESDAGRFVALHGSQRLYTNFFRLALNDSDAFIPREAARLDSAGHPAEANAMRAFARAVGRAAQDTCVLRSADFDAVEAWASLLSRGHWAEGTIPHEGAERLAYLGTLEWYGLAPEPADERRIWMGPRLLVREGDSDGYVADDIPRTAAGCPRAWTGWRTGAGTAGAVGWSGQWIGSAPQLAPVIELGRSLAGRLLGR